MLPQSAAAAQLSQPVPPFERRSRSVGINIPEDTDQQSHRLASLGYLQLRLLPALRPECSAFELNKNALLQAVARENFATSAFTQTTLSRPPVQHLPHCVHLNFKPPPSQLELSATDANERQLCRRKPAM